MKLLQTRRGPLRLPSFLPDATRAVVKGLDSRDIAECGIEALMVNSLHLATRPGISTVQALGGIHRFMTWDGIAASDSGGFQAWSMAATGAGLGSVTDKGFVYRHDKGGKKHLLTPEKCIKRQLDLGADILFCLDQCTHPDEPAGVQEASVARTLAWARRCRAEFVARTGAEPGSGNGGDRPLLFAVVQGGNDPALRRTCAEELAAMGFDGFGFGGWPVDKAGALVDMVAHVAAVLPAEAPKHALGIGRPDNLVAAWRAGYHIFDCALPTRDARHRRLIVGSGLSSSTLSNNDFYDLLYMEDERHSRDASPLDADDPEGPSRAYLHHLFKIKDSAAERLATRQNLGFYARLMRRLRELDPAA